MIDQYSDDRTGWARFSDDMTMRYRLARALPLLDVTALPIDIDTATGRVTAMRRVVFLMLNPSIADAFIVDPTIRECIKFTRYWGADVLEVVNLFALRSTDPAGLKKYACGYRGDDSVNDQQISEACAGAWRVIAAWGCGGNLEHRDSRVCNMLQMCNVNLGCLGRTLDGFPKHPLARGRHRISADQQPIPWSP